MDKILEFLTPTIQAFGLFGYWVALLAALLESVVFFGTLVPGSIVIVFFGFLASRGYYDIGDLIWFTTLGAIIGDSLGFYLGKRPDLLAGWKFFTVFRERHLRMGVDFFERHGGKSVFFGRFFGPVRSIVPYVAGSLKMPVGKFLWWNILSALIWTAVHLFLGYFLGSTWYLAEIWSTRLGFFILSLFVVILIFSWLRAWVVRQGRSFFRLLLSLLRSLGQGIANNQEVKRFFVRHPRLMEFLRRRFDRRYFWGLPFTILALAFVYVLALFLGIVEGIVTQEAITSIDINLANLIYVFRHPGLVRFFLYITILGRWTFVVPTVFLVSVLLWRYRRKIYLLSFWLSVGGAGFFVWLTKLIFHRPRPLGLIPVYFEPTYSFPSGHAALAVALYGFLIYLAWRFFKKWRCKVNILFAGILVIAAIGFSRLYLGVHFLSDVTGGYTLGFLWLIAAIAIAEFLRRRQMKANPRKKLSARQWVWLFIVLAFNISFYVFLAAAYQPVLSDGQGQQPAAPVVATASVLFTNKNFSRYTENINGNPMEPLSFMISAEDDQTLATDFEKAGWLLADQISFNSTWEISMAVINRQTYARAPMTPSFWQGQVNDFGFEKLTSSGLVNQRHHARFWKTNYQDSHGNNIYAGTASFDAGIKWLVMHAIKPDIDSEREFLFNDLQSGGAIEDFHKEKLVEPILGANALGDQFFTDGQAYYIELK